MNTEAHQAFVTEDLGRLASAVAAGADVNDFVSPKGERPLTVAIESFQCPARRHAALNMLLAAGADPKLPDDEEFLGPLFSAVLARDSESLRILLAAGADPALEHRGVGETLYEAPGLDYLLETWMMELAAQPTEADRAPEDAWLSFLKRTVIEHGRPGPGCMSVL
jgi:ankyrin repeat protein